MDWLKGLRARLRRMVFRSAADREAEEEFRFHPEMEAERLMGEGLSAEEARRRALINFGGVTQHKEALREGWGIRWLESLWKDFRVAARGLRRAPGLVAGVAVSLGIAVGLNTAMFAFVDAALLKPIPAAPAGDRLVHVNIKRGEWEYGGASYPDYLEYRERTRTLEGLATHTIAPATVRLEGGLAERRYVAVVSGDFFEVLGLRPAAGRFFVPEEDRTPGTHPVVVVSHHYWQRELDGDPAAVGRTVWSIPWR